LHGTPNELMKNKFDVWNRCHKYYVIGFAIDYTRFEVYSKGCDKQLFSWISDLNSDEINNEIENFDSEDKIAANGIITDPEYNLNPVIKVMRSLNI